VDVGFTGTRQGMTDRQKLALSSLLYLLHGDCEEDSDDLVFHHGGEPHADQEAAMIASGVFWSTKKYRPAKKDAKHLLERNHKIVDAVSILIAAPRSLAEEVRSGTWATVRYARKTMTSVIFLDP